MLFRRGLDLDPESMERLLALSRIRGETPEDLLARFGRKALRGIPRGILKHAAALVKQEFLASGVVDGLAWVEISGGRRFYGLLSRDNHRREHEYLKDLIPAITADTYLLAKDITHRYLTDVAWHPPEVLPGPGGTVVEVGAYLGHKSVRYVDRCVGPSGRVLAIEMIPENVRVLRRNVQENGLQGAIDIEESGAWNEAGRRPVRGKGRQRNSLVDLEQLGPDLGELLPTDTLDAILDRWGRERIDLLAITVNGAEVEVLQGLQRWWPAVRAIQVVARYEVEGRSTREPCLEILESHGFRVLPGNRIIAIAPGGGA